MTYPQRMQLLGMTIALAALCCRAETVGAYTQPVSVVNSGGGVSSSAGYENLASIGQPVIGLSSGAGGSNHAGFIPALGGYGLLWPVIGFDPASASFILFIGEPSPPPQGLTLTNRGGSTLEWTVARTQTWLTLTPLSGTGSSSVAVGINPGASGLLPGLYTDTITVSAVGAENSGVAIPVTLTVGQEYALTISFASSTTPAGGGTIVFTPPPPVGAATCSGNPCQRSFFSGTPVTLTAYGDGNSRLDRWSGECAGGSCSVTMSANRAVTATFSYVPPAMIEGTGRYYTSLQAAYGAALNGQTIRARMFTFVEDLTLDQAKGVVIKGGYDTNYAVQPGYTLLQGKLTVEGGAVVTERLTVK